MYVYLPSCQFTGMDPDASRKISSYLATRPDTRVAGCCRPEQKRLTAEDVAVTVCMSCAAITREASPQTTEISIWEHLLKDESFPWPDYHGERMTIQDCWRARNRPEVHAAVRQCMERMNLTVVELAENRERAQFDGVWRFRPVAKRNLDIAPTYFSDVQAHGLELLPEEQQRRRMEEWVQQYQTERVVAYCNACVKGIVLGGARGVHLLQLATKELK